MKKDYSLPRLIIFFIGLAIVIALPLLIIPAPFIATEKGTFVYIIIVLLYLGYALPLVFNYFHRAGSDRVFVGGVFYYRGIGIFTVISVITCALLLKGQIQLKTGIAFELIALFIAIIFCYLAYRVSNKIHEVADYEQSKKEVLYNLRNAASNLQIILNNEYQGDSEIINAVNELQKNFRYLTPSDDKKAKELEEKMLNRVLSITSSDLTINNPSNAKVVKDYLNELKIMYMQRKKIN